MQKLEKKKKELYKNGRCLLEPLRAPVMLGDQDANIIQLEGY